VAKKSDTGKKAHLVVLTVLFFLAGSTFLCPRNATASAGLGPTMVLFTTQKVFAPQQLVTLYADVSYNDAPVSAGYLVSFQVNGPSNEFENITIFGSGTTNATGLAAFSFRIPWPSDHQEEIVFGNWSALASVDIAQMTAIGTWTFLVGWILQITSITTLNSAFMPQTTFFRQDVINFNLTVKNIATVTEPAAVTIEAVDADDYPMFNITMQGLTFQPGESQLNGSSRIPDTAAIGNATATAAIYTTLPDEGGFLYSPTISTEFEVSERPVHDIGLTSITLSTGSVYVGGIVDIYVTAKDNGTATENFGLSAYYNSSLIETLQVTLTPGSQVSETLSWNTSTVKPGLYQISASAPLAGDVSPGDNTLTDGYVQVMTPVPSVSVRPLWIILLIILLLFLLTLLAILLLRRRKTDESELLERVSLYI